MADIAQGSLTQVGDFLPTAYSIANISSGVTGTLVTITPPAGKKVRLNALTSSASQAGISVIVDGGTVVSALTLEPRASNSGFCVGNMSTPGGSGGTGAAGDGANVIPYLQGFSSISIAKNAGNTSSSIYYSYLYGD